jgi:Na+(H+)/acetate symporter ActP
MISFQFGGASIQNVLYSLENLGLRDFILPFILIFTLLYAVLSKIAMFRKEDLKKTNTIIALVIALLVVIPHVLGQYPPNKDVVEIINNALPGVSLVLVGVLCVILLLGLFGRPQAVRGGLGGGIITAAAIVIVVFIFGQSAGLWRNPWNIPLFNDPQFLILVVTLIVFWLVIKAITSEPQEPGAGEQFKEAFKGLGDFIYGKGGEQQ